jgi:hypothetical protein
LSLPWQQEKPGLSIVQRWDHDWSQQTVACGLCRVDCTQADDSSRIAHQFQRWIQSLALDTAKWIAGADVQVAPQETEISSSYVGGTKQDVDSNTFTGMSL